MSAKFARTLDEETGCSAVVVERLDLSWVVAYDCNVEEAKRSTIVCTTLVSINGPQGASIEMLAQHIRNEKANKCFSKDPASGDHCILPPHHSGKMCESPKNLWYSPLPQNPFHDEILRQCVELGPFLVKKNEAYGDSTRRIVSCLQSFYPDGIPLAQIENAYYMLQILNKLSRVATDCDPFGEDPWLDAAGYSILAHAKRELDKKRNSGG